MGNLSQFIITHWHLWVLLTLVLLFIAINELLAQKKRAETLSPQQAVALLNEEKTIVVDVRDKEAYQKGHIINAIHATMDDFEKRMDKYKSKPILIVCARGLQSGPLAAKLRQQGFTSPMVLGGGISAWQEAGLPLHKGK